MMERPPCWPEGQPCPSNCASQLYQRVIYNHTPLWGAWEGFRMAGADLVSPDGQRISVHRMKGLLWREQMERLKAGYISRRQAEANRVRVGGRNRVKVMIVDLQDYRENGIAAA